MKINPTAKGLKYKPHDDVMQLIKIPLAQLSDRQSTSPLPKGHHTIMVEHYIGLDQIKCMLAAYNFPSTTVTVKSIKSNQTHLKILFYNHDTNEPALLREMVRAGG